MGWIAYVLAWLAAALFWALASAASASRSPLETFPFGLLAMGSAAVMGVAVWRLTNRVAWDWRAPSFYVAHATALVIFSVVYSTFWFWPELAMGRFKVAADSLRSSPIIIWNLLMGSWLYLVVAGLSYAIRAHRRIRTQEAAAAEARLLAQQAQLVALRAQINPHFLFNALHSVGALVTCDPVRADKALECLGDLLRYALGTEDEVFFSQEWKFTQDYLAFEELRLGDRLRVDAAADDGALAIMVPPLILQPLVENAVRHGIADRPEGGRIELRARVEGPRLVLSVVDDGCGGGAEAREGVGLTSVRRRLAALYGGRATFNIDRMARGFSITIGLPLDAADLSMPLGTSRLTGLGTDPSKSLESTA
jgi:two-component system, LytTR family, sensor kinase